MRRQLSFGPFTLDADARQLVHGSHRRHVHLSPKAFDLLTLLAEERDALGERGREGRFVRTVQRFGCSFVATAQEASSRHNAIPRTWIICDREEQALADGERIIGRDHEVSISLKSPSVSRRHARIELTFRILTSGGSTETLRR